MSSVLFTILICLSLFSNLDFENHLTSYSSCNIDPLVAMCTQSIPYSDVLFFLLSLIISAKPQHLIDAFSKLQLDVWKKMSNLSDFRTGCFNAIQK